MRSSQQRNFAEYQLEKKNIAGEGFFFFVFSDRVFSDLAARINFRVRNRSAAARLLRPLAPCGQSDARQLPFTLIGIKIFPGQELQEKFGISNTRISENKC